MSLGLLFDKCNFWDPPEIMEMPKIPTNNLLPKKFRDRYECLSNIYELERKK
jgi:hypothetical protein